MMMDFNLKFKFLSITGFEKRVTQELVLVLQRLSLLLALLQHAATNQRLLELPRRFQLAFHHRIQANRVFSTLARNESIAHREISTQLQPRSSGNSSSSRSDSNCLVVVDINNYNNCDTNESHIKIDTTNRKRG